MHTGDVEGNATIVTIIVVVDRASSWRLSKSYHLHPESLGAFDDLFSGQPFGSAILLWSVTMIVVEAIETRFPWRGFWQDWFTAGLGALLYILLAMIVSDASFTVPMLVAALPQIIVAIVLHRPTYCGF